MSFLKGLEKYLFLPLVGALIGTFVQIVFYPPGANGSRFAGAYSAANSSNSLHYWGADSEKSIGAQESKNQLTSQNPNDSKMTGSGAQEFRLPVPIAQPSWSDTMVAVGVAATLAWLFWVSVSR
jgi:hypothetical protein